MRADEIAIFIPIIAILSGAFIAISAIYTKYRLKVEQIKAEALIRAEEIRAKNQLDIEKLFLADNGRSNARPSQAAAEGSADLNNIERNSRMSNRY